MNTQRLTCVLRLYSIMFVVLIMAGCDQTVSTDDARSHNAKTDTDWVKDEILQQLSELRTELRAIKTDIANVDNKIAVLQLAGVTEPASHVAWM